MEGAGGGKYSQECCNELVIGPCHAGETGCRYMRDQGSGGVTSSHYINYKFLNPDVLFSTRAKNNIWLNALRAFNQAGKKF